MHMLRSFILEAQDFDWHQRARKTLLHPRLPLIESTNHTSCQGLCPR